MITPEVLWEKYLETQGYQQRSYPWASRNAKQKQMWEDFTTWVNDQFVPTVKTRNETGYEEAINIIIWEWPREALMKLYRILYNIGCRIS